METSVNQIATDFEKGSLTIKASPCPDTQKKSVFLKKVKMEINMWEDSPSFALSKTLLSLIKYLIFGENF